MAWGPLRYLYVGSDDADRDIAFWERALGASAKAWDHREFGTRVALFRTGAGPPWIVAGHRKPGVLPIYAVADLDGEVRALSAAGWEPLGDEVEVPDGPCRIFRDPSGNEVCLLQPVRGAPLGT